MRYIKYTKEQIENAVKQSFSIANVLRVLGIRQAGGNQCHMKRRIIKFGIDCSHFKGCAWNKGRKFPSKLTAEKVLVKRKDGRRQNAVYLRRALKEIGREYKCEFCGNTGEWLGKKLTLQVDHINSDWLDDRRENLRFLCPNCHHQTSNFGSQKHLINDDKQSKISMRIRKPKKIVYCLDCNKKIDRKAIRCKSCVGKLKHQGGKRPSKEQLEKDLTEIKVMVKIGKKYDVSDNAVRKWIKYYDLVVKTVATKV
jgi:5-methylcytosine-specific restriction endonuclease McrA